MFSYKGHIPTKCMCTEKIQNIPVEFNSDVDI